MHRHHRDIVLDGFHHRPLHIILARNLLQGMEQQGMMTHDEVATLGHSLIHHLLGHVQTQQCP